MRRKPWIVPAGDVAKFHAVRLGSLRDAVQILSLHGDVDVLGEASGIRFDGLHVKIDGESPNDVIPNSGR